MFKESALNHTKKIKVSHFTYDYVFSVENKAKVNGFSLQYYWFARLIMSKLVELGIDTKSAHVPSPTNFKDPEVASCIIRGIIYKKSQYLKKW